jgi:hypothetical protein
MVFFRDICVGRHDLTPQNTSVFLRIKLDPALTLNQNSIFEMASSFLLIFAEIRFRGFNEKVNIFSFR